jgi:hypothetical protein
VLPQPGLLSVDAGPFAGEAEVLAREASANNVDWEEVGELSTFEESHVPELWDAWPVLLEHGAAESVLLAEGDGTEAAGSFESQGKSSDAAEDVEDAEHVTYRSSQR